ncbi:hypothetical protein SDC9_96382 [bioreactor metagenome]|uniref:Uncharacterized protein n=1 Tax=bioreactor metagenome TaxID=1076179 RepID=A0A645A940_9ZZZZ
MRTGGSLKCSLVLDGAAVRRRVADKSQVVQCGAAGFAAAQAVAQQASAAAMDDQVVIVGLPTRNGESIDQRVIGTAFVGAVIAVAATETGASDHDQVVVVAACNVLGAGRDVVGYVAVIASDVAGQHRLADIGSALFAGAGVTALEPQGAIDRKTVRACAARFVCALFDADFRAVTAVVVRLFAGQRALQRGGRVPTAGVGCGRTFRRHMADGLGMGIASGKPCGGQCKRRQQGASQIRGQTGGWAMEVHAQSLLWGVGRVSHPAMRQQPWQRKGSIRANQCLG